MKYISHIKLYFSSKSNRKFAIISSVLLTTLFFSIYFAQVLFSDVLTFEKNGDNLKLCYPAMLKIGEYIQKGKLNGVDVGTFNGATEFFLRSNLPNMYLPAIAFAKAMIFIPRGFTFLMFYIIHMLIALYYSQRLAQRFFRLNRWVSLIFTTCVACIILYENWYLSFYIISCLVCPLLYFSFDALQNNKKLKWILYSFPYILAFTSGYITVSITLVGVSFLTTIIYGLLFIKEETKKNIIIRSIIPPFIAGIVCSPFCIELLYYMKDVVQHASSSISDTLYYTLDIRNIPLIISNSFTPTNLVEQIPLMTIGAIWCLVILLIIENKTISKLSKQHKYLFWISIIVNVTILFIAFGIATPLALWFYSFVPIFGAMHLPMRYMMVTLPLLYISLCITLKYLPEQKHQKKYKILSQICFCSAIIISLISPYIKLMLFTPSKMVLELILISVTLYLIFTQGLKNKITIIFWCLTILLPSLNNFYAINEVNVNGSIIKERSIVYNLDYQNNLDNFISTLENKDLYRFAAFDSVSAVPDFIPGNYSWYDDSEYNISNYMGYELQLCLPYEYSQKIPWFNRMDWSYIANTRGDFLVLDNQEIENNKEILNLVVDWDQSNRYINSQNRILRLKKFIPSHYTGTDFMVDDLNTMDNGYFYSNSLRNEALLDFRTDNATYYTAKIHTTVNTDILFLLYPNRYYHYYIDNIEIEPVIENMQAFIPITKGEHTIQIKYENQLNEISNIIFKLYYYIIILTIITAITKRLIKSNVKS